MARNRVKMQIFGITRTPKKSGRSIPVTVASSGAGTSSFSERRMSPQATSESNVLRTGSSMTPAERAEVSSTGKLSPSLAAGIDQSLNAGPVFTRSNPIASILVKVPSADSLKFEGSRLYKDEKGDWVADLLPENTP